MTSGGGSGTIHTHKNETERTQMKNVIATAGTMTAWAKANDKAITMWHRGTSWYIGIRHADNTNTILPPELDW